MQAGTMVGGILANQPLLAAHDLRREYYLLPAIGGLPTHFGKDNLYELTGTFSFNKAAVSYRVTVQLDPTRPNDGKVVLCDRVVERLVERPDTGG
jgi:hypothetical protein